MTCDKLDVNWLNRNTAAFVLARISVNFPHVTHPELFPIALATTVNRYTLPAISGEFSIFYARLLFKSLFFFSSFVVESSVGGCDSSFCVSVGDSALSDIFK